jgi:hypothetical protein
MCDGLLLRINRLIYVIMAHSISCIDDVHDSSSLRSKAAIMSWYTNTHSKDSL